MENNEKPLNFRGNRRNSIYEVVGTKRVQKRRKKLSFFEQQQSTPESQLRIFGDKSMKFCER